MPKRKPDSERDLINARIAINTKRTMVGLRSTVALVVSAGVPADAIIFAAMSTANRIGFREAQRELAG